MKISNSIIQNSLIQSFIQAKDRIGELQGTFNHSKINHPKFNSVGKKFALNIFYNLGIILSICGIIWCYQNGKYLPAGFLVGTAACLIYFKIQLMKEIRKSFTQKGQD